MSLMIPADRQVEPNKIDRYDFFNAIIDLTYYIQIGTQNNLPVYEEVPLGIFKVADADRPHDTVNLTAYDNMTMLDIDIGSKYDILKNRYCCILILYILRKFGVKRSYPDLLL
jgi:hypothetical protein